MPILFPLTLGSGLSDGDGKLGFLPFPDLLGMADKIADMLTGCDGGFE